jgi:hypothetical protein
MSKPNVFSHISDEWVTTIVQTHDTRQIGCVVRVSSDEGGSTWKAEGSFACCCVVNDGLSSVQLNIPAGHTLSLKNGQGLSACYEMRFLDGNT